MPPRERSRSCDGPILIRQLSWADGVTSTAILVVVQAFWWLWRGQTDLAVALACISMFLDHIDGVVARRWGSSAYGRVLDSLYDVLGWVVFPATVINLRLDWAWWVVAVTSLFCLSGLLRLSRFTVEGYIGESQLHYAGLPVLFSQYPLLASFLWPPLGGLMLAPMVPWMLSERRVPKPHALLAYLLLVYAALFIWRFLIHA